MEKARQLHCGHLFCAECVTRMLAMPKVRCAVCKEKTGKRMVRAAPLPFADIIANLRILEAIVEQNNLKSDNKQVTSYNDGFEAVLNTTLMRINRTPKQNVLPSVPSADHVGSTSSPPSARRVCVLCPKGIHPSSFSEEIQFGAMKRALSDKKKKQIFAHERCALFTADVYEVEGEFENVERSLVRSKKTTCSRETCGRTHPNVQCAFEKCQNSYHYPCAREEGCVLVEDGYKMFCVQHKAKAPSIDDSDFEKSLSDPKEVISLMHANACYHCNRGGRLLMCDSCDRVTHPACSGLKAIPLGDWNCGVCTGVDKLAVAQTTSDNPSSKKGKPYGTSKRKRGEVVDTVADVSMRGSVSNGSKRPRRSSEGGKRFCLAHTGLQETQRDQLRGIAKARKAIIKPDLEGRVTHLVIAARTPSDVPSRTMKLCKAIAARIPIVCWNWVEESSKSDDAWVAIDDHIHPLTWKDKEGVFSGKRFYFGGFNGAKEKKEQLIALIQVGGGSVGNREGSVGKMASQGSLLCVRDEEVKRNGRRELYGRFEPPTGATVVSSGWILDQCTKNRSGWDI